MNEKSQLKIWMDSAVLYAQTTSGIACGCVEGVSVCFKNEVKVNHGIERIAAIMNLRLSEYQIGGVREKFVVYRGVKFFSEYWK